MYFTREPMIQTIISAREGYTICLRSLTSEEEISVEVVELVTFDTVAFYRCNEKGNSYLFPVLNYQLFEERVQGMVLKSPVRKEKEIKIGKGKGETEPSQKEDKKKSRKKNKSNRPKESLEREEVEQATEEAVTPAVEQQKKVTEKREKTSPRFLIPPPEGLISDSLHKTAIKRVEPALVPQSEESESQPPPEE